MKNRLFCLVCILLADIGAIFAWDYWQVKIDSLYYNLDATNRTAEVTYQKLNLSTNYSGLTTANIPEKVTHNSVTYNITSIGDYAFRFCTSLTSVTIPSSITSIGREAFRWCGLPSVTIPSSVTSIGEMAFDCNYLTEINVATDNSNYSSQEGVLFNKGTTALIQYPRGRCGVYTIPSNVICIERFAFYCCSLTSVTIPQSVASIGEVAFGYSFALTEINVAADNTSFSSIDGVLFNKPQTILIQCPCGKEGVYAIPSSVTQIGDNAFDYCISLTSVTIPNSVTSIGSGAFVDCKGLTSITCEAIVPPTCGGSIFIFTTTTQTYSYPLYVLTGSVAAYKAADQWKNFGDNIKPIQASEVDITDVVVEPTDNGAVIQWPTISGAYTYELVIKDRNGNIVCTLIFNEQGQLTSIAFNAPKRHNAPQQTQTAGFAFTVTGLDSGTRYTATITSKASNGSVLNTKTVSFTTTGQSQAINHLNGEPSVDNKKIIRNGQLFIQQGDKIYNAQGARIE